MRTLSLKHLQPLACEAYAGLLIYPKKRLISNNEFTVLLNDYVRNIRSVVPPAVASSNLEAVTLLAITYYISFKIS